MSIELKVHVSKTEDQGMEFYDRIGAVVVRVDGSVLASNPNAVKLTKIGEADDFNAPLYSVQIDENLEVSIQSWNIGSVQVGKVAELLENADI